VLCESRLALSNELIELEHISPSTSVSIEGFNSVFNRRWRREVEPKLSTGRVPANMKASSRHGVSIFREPCYLHEITGKSKNRAGLLERTPQQPQLILLSYLTEN
jgi:hypothetical protein